MTLSYDDTYAALQSAVVGRVVDRDVVTAVGPDAASYLQGQCSQDLEGMAPGEARRSLVLNPQGKVVALVRVVAVASDSFAVEVEHGWGAQVFDRLRRFRLRVKVELEEATWRCAEVRGPAATSAANGAVAGGVLVLRLDDRFGRGVDLLGPEAELPSGVPAGDPAAFEAARIEAGVPAMGSELDESVIPQEAGIVDTTVSFTKGCYTGQELVARLDARGSRVARVLRGVVVAAGEADVGSVLLNGEKQVGVLTSAARLPGRGSVGLAYVRREVEPPAVLRLVPAGVTGPGEQPEGLDPPVVAEVRALPL